MIWRDDDISKFTKFPEFKAVHEIFQRYGVVHTLALICKDLEDNKELVDYINENKKQFDLQIHCWEHYNHATHLVNEDLLKAKNKIIELFGVTPTTIYPPWNLSSQSLEFEASLVGLNVSTEKITLSAYIRTMGAVKETTVNFHYWADAEAILIEPCLKIYTRKRKQNICEL